MTQRHGGAHIWTHGGTDMNNTLHMEQHRPILAQCHRCMEDDYSWISPCGPNESLKLWWTWVIESYVDKIFCRYLPLFFLKFNLVCLFLRYSTQTITSWNLTGSHSMLWSPIISKEATAVTHRLGVWKQEWRPTRNGWLEATSKTCFSVWTQSMSWCFKQITVISINQSHFQQIKVFSEEISCFIIFKFQGVESYKTQKKIEKEITISGKKKEFVS